MRWIERRNTPDGPRYRYWCSVVDCYLTEPVTRAEMAELLTSSQLSHRDSTGDHVEERLARTDERGTSALWFGPIDMDAPWSTECCAECGRFHHAYEGDGACGQCGEPASDIAHSAECGHE